MNNSKKFLSLPHWMHFGESPVADWKTIFIFGIICTLLLVAFDISIFLNLDKNQMSGGEDTSTTQAPDEQKFAHTIIYYADHTASLDSLNLDVPRDPSL
ncbi:hypothetical protein KW807_02000 [Candidatus Parcubacteria bacterium]|nr:hypothetical protein [Candidatus Parcubacteria bacterium]